MIATHRLAPVLLLGLMSCVGPMGVSRRSHESRSGIPYALPRTVLEFTLTISDPTAKGQPPVPVEAAPAAKPAATTAQSPSGGAAPSTGLPAPGRSSRAPDNSPVVPAVPQAHGPALGGAGKPPPSLHENPAVPSPSAAPSPGPSPAELALEEIWSTQFEASKGDPAALKKWFNTQATSSADLFRHWLSRMSDTQRKDAITAFAKALGDDQAATALLARLLAPRQVTPLPGEASSPDEPEFVKLQMTVAQRTVADAANRFTLEYNTTENTSDDIAVDLTPEGLLSKYAGTSKDETLGVLENTVSAISKAVQILSIRPMFKAAFDAPTSDSGAGGPEDELARRREFRRRLRSAYGVHKFFWSFPDAGCASASSSIASPVLYPVVGDDWWQLKVRADPVTTHGAAADLPDALAVGGRGTVPPPKGGIVVRSVDPYVVTAEFEWRLILPPEEAPRKDPVARVHTRALYHLPDYAAKYVVPLDRVAFVKTEYEITADANGHLTRVATKRPSKALAASDSVGKVFDTILSLPADILSIKVKALNEFKNYEDARTNFLRSKQGRADLESGFELGRAADTAFDKAEASRLAFDGMTSPSERHRAWATFRADAYAANRAADRAERDPPYAESDLVEPGRDEQVALTDAAERARLAALDARAEYDRVGFGPNTSAQRLERWREFSALAQAANTAALKARVPASSVPFPPEALKEPGREEQDKAEAQADVDAMKALRDKAAFLAAKQALAAAPTDGTRQTAFDAAKRIFIDSAITANVSARRAGLTEPYADPLNP